MRVTTASLRRHLVDLGWDEVYVKESISGGVRVAASGPESGDAVAGEPISTLPSGAGPEQRARALATVEAQARKCIACALHAKRNSVVFGSGNADARLMVIGEGPGAREDQRGLPFVGPAGELLTKMLAAIDLPRETVYIANMVKCRPPGNRDPKPEEVAACARYLEAQVALIQPSLLLVLGRVAAQSLLSSAESLGRLRGRWHEAYGVPLRVTYHPAALLRNSGFKRPTWEDLQLVRDRLVQTHDDSG